MNEYRFIITEDSEGERVDRIAALLMPDCSRTYIQKLISSGELFINGKVPKASTKVSSGDELFLSVPEPVIPEIKPENIPLDIVFENGDFIIVNKGKDMVVHPAPGHLSGTLVNAIMYHCHDLSGINGMLRPGIVHRIDKDTTGLLVICKNDDAHRKLAEQFKDHSIERTYEAIVHGRFSETEGVIDAPLGRSSQDRKKMTVVQGGKRAVTHYSVIKQYDDFAHVRLKLETGRTHQIRVHMAYKGHPVLGDEVYGVHEKSFKNTCGQALHAKTLGFEDPSGSGWMQFDSELPDYFKDILNKL